MNFKYKEDGVSLYIHIPFCKQKCLYCDFPSYSNKESYMLDYIKALSKEIEKIDNNINTIFIGGGTPTYLSLDAIKILKNSIKKLNKKDDIEFTIEANPGTFNKEKLRLFQSMGVNRLSIGLQAWQNSILKSLGRIHSVQEFVNGYNMARELGFNNINIDLMFGLPDQTLENWKETLENVIKLSPEHLSCYSLIVEEGTPFCKMLDKECLNIPSEELERKMYHATLEILNNNGYNQYEISNFCKNNKECKHNLVYWNLNEYIGVGASSHSYFKNSRFSNELNIEKYIHRINSEGTAIIENHKNTTKDDIEEFMFIGLRKTTGISTLEFEKRFNKNINSLYGKVINKHISNGLLIKDKNRIYLSPKGIELSNIVMADFILD